MTEFLIRAGFAAPRIVVSFYAFWFVWRLLLPVLPGPPGHDARIAPYAEYFTDPLVDRLARFTRLPQRAATLTGFIIVVTTLAALEEVEAALL